MLKIKKPKIFVSILITYLLVLSAAVAQIPDKPMPPRLVNDFTGVLSDKQSHSLEKKLVRFNDTTSNQITVVIVNSLGDYTPAMFATEIGLQWKVGQKEFDNGIVVLVKPKLNDRDKGHAYIAVGYGLEPAIPDAITKRIIENEMIPSFRENNYYQGINKATTVLMEMASGKKGELWDKKGMLYVTDSALAITYDDNDSLFIHSDTMWLNFDKDRKVKMMKAYYGVRFYRKNLQGKCDSLSYSMSDSTIRMYYEPVLWSGKNQLTSDSIAIAISNNKVDSLMMYNTAFIVSKDSTNTFNQIRGKNMTAYFARNELSKIVVNGNAQTIYYVREEDGYLIGVDLAEASGMTIRIENSEIKTISYKTSVDEDMFPEEGLTKEQTRLKNFTWQNLIRPSSKFDIFSIDE